MLKWITQYSTPLLIGVAVLVAGLWVHDHTQQAVARALVQQQLDSIATKITQDSIAAAARDSSARIQIAQQAASEAAAQAFAQAAHTAMHAAIDSLQVAKSASDSIVIYQVALQKADTVIAQQQNAIAAADAQVVALRYQVSDRDQQIANLRGIAGDLQRKLERATHQSVWNGTTITIVKTLLAVKGAADLVRGR